MSQHLKEHTNPQIISRGGKRVAKRKLSPAEERVRSALSKTASLWGDPSQTPPKGKEPAGQMPSAAPEAAKPASAKPAPQAAKPASAKPAAQAAKPASAKPAAQAAKPASAKPAAQAAKPASAKPAARAAEPASAKPAAQAAKPGAQRAAAPAGAQAPRRPAGPAPAQRKQPQPTPGAGPAPQQRSAAPRAAQTQAAGQPPLTVVQRSAQSVPAQSVPAQSVPAASQRPAQNGKAAAAQAAQAAAQPAFAPVLGVVEETAPPEEVPERKGGLAGRAADIGRTGGAVLKAKWWRLRQSVRQMRRHWHHVLREEKANRFPESDRLPVLLALFAWNMLPMALNRLREHTWGKRKGLAHKVGQITARFEHKKVRPAPFFAVGGAVALIALFFSFYTFGTTVVYDGRTVAAVGSRAAAEDARSDLEKITARTLGTDYTIDESLLQYSSGLLPRRDVVDASDLEEDLSQEIGLVTYGYALYVDGELIGATPYEGALDELLLQLRAGVSDENTISCDFAEDVEIKPGYIPTEQVMNLGYLAETLYSTKTAEVTYTVKAGDTWSEIANDHGLTSAELLALNPGYNIDKLSIGEVLTLSASVPYLTMTVVEQERYLDSLAYDIEYTDSADLYKGDYKVISAGEYGSADVLANVTYVNGEEQERTILSSVTLKEPVTEQRLQGTKERPTWLPTGTFRWPCSGKITSRFGYRNLSYSYASHNHKGIDIAGSYGTAVCAADGGTVVYAGWMSGYGYLVQVDHGNGYVTYYGHNSSLVVSVGQHVYKGQQIARMGSTGNSTGNHCHFEVRYNGVARNPLNYLP